MANLDILHLQRSRLINHGQQNIPGQRHNTNRKLTSGIVKISESCFLSNVLASDFLRTCSAVVVILLGSTFNVHNREILPLHASIPTLFIRSMF